MPEPTAVELLKYAETILVHLGVIIITLLSFAELIRHKYSLLVGTEKPRRAKPGSKRRQHPTA